jgi:tetratricopeptide (TPR) repeat protein
MRWAPWLVMAYAGLAAAEPLGDASRHIERLEYDQALASIEEARRAAGNDSARLAQTWLLEGTVDVALDREEQALAAFRRALRFAPTIGPRREASPKIRAVFDRASAAEADRSRRRTAASVKLVPPPPPPVASRALDVAAEVIAPFEGLTVRLQVAAAPGLSATLPMVRTHGESYSAHVPAEFVVAGCTLAFRAELVDEGDVIARSSAALALPAHRAALQILSPIVGAELSIGGKPVGRTPLDAPVPVEPGRLHVALRSIVGTVSQDVDARAGEITTVTLALASHGSSKIAVARYSLLAGGAALLIVSAVLAAEAGTSAQSLGGSIARDPGSGLPTTEFSQVRGFDTNGRAFATASIATLVVGAVCVVTGAALFAWRKRSAERSRAVATKPSLHGLEVRF